MTNEELKKLLEAELIGKELGLSKRGNRTVRDIENLVKPLLNEEVAKLCGCEYDSRVVWLKYKNCRVFGVKFKTKKEYDHKPYSNTWYTYIIQSIELLGSTSSEEISKRIADIDLTLDNKEQARQREEDEMYACYKQVVALFGDKTYSIITYLYKHQYWFECRLKKETKNA